jgi:hypothetical protein
MRRRFRMHKMKLVTLIPCLLATVLAGCATGPKHGGQHTPPHARFQRYGAYYLKPLYITPPHGRVRTNVEGSKKIESELADHMKWVFPNLVQIRDEADLGDCTSPALVIEPIIEKMKFVDNRVTIRGSFRGSSFVQARVNFRDLTTGRTVASPVFYRRASGAAGGFSWGATDHIMLSRIVWDVFDYVTMGTVPSNSIPPGTDARTVDPSEEELARTVPVVPRPVKSGIVGVAGQGSAATVGAPAGEAGQNGAPVSGAKPTVNIMGANGPASQAELVEIAMNEKDLQMRKDAVTKMTDQKCIGKVACDARDSGVRLAAVQKLSDQALLGNIAVRERHWKVRMAAVERLVAFDVLDSVAARDEVPAVRDAARARLALLKR